MRGKFLFVILIIALFQSCSASAGKKADADTGLHFVRQGEYDLPVPGIDGIFSAVVDGNIMIAGGAAIDSCGNEILSDKVFYRKDGKWIEIGKIHQGIAYGESVQTPQGLICLGGKTVNGVSADVFLLQYESGGLSVKELPSIPGVCMFLSATLKNDILYAVGTDADSQTASLFSMNLKNGIWEKMADLPGKPITCSVLSVHFDGVSDMLYLIGGKCGSDLIDENWAYRLDGHKNKWVRMADIPEPIAGASVLSQGYSGLILLGGRASEGNNSKVYVYYPVNDTWAQLENLPDKMSCTTALSEKNSITLISSDKVVACRLEAAKVGGFTVLDFIALGVYLLVIVFVAKYFSNKNKSSKDFFLGGRKIPFWAAGLSMMAAQVSAIGFMSIPAKSFMTDWSYFGGVLTWFIVVPVVIYAFVPFYRRLNVTSAYEYLEFRFNKIVRKFIAGLYLIFQLIGRSSVVIFLPAIALSAVTGMSPIICIVIIGGLATLYTAMGGMKAVIWVDVIQTFVLFGAIFLCIGYVFFHMDMGLSDIVRVAVDDNKFSLGRMDWDATAPVFWIIVIGNVFNRIGSNATDQSVVQRYLTTKDEKSTAKALWTDALVSIPWAICVFGLGTALYVFYKTNPQMLTPMVTNDEIVPFFIAQNLPSGISGIVIAGIFAAAISSVDSSIHSSTTVIMRDFMGKYLGIATEESQVRTARVITILIGLLGTLIAIAMTFFDIKSVWDVVLEIASLFTGAMTGVFLLGIFTERTSGTGVMIGAVSSAVVLFFVKTYTPLNFFLYSGIGIISCVIIGYFASMIFKSGKSTSGLTIYTVKESSKQ